VGGSSGAGGPTRSRPPQTTRSRGSVRDTSSRTRSSVRSGGRSPSRDLPSGRATVGKAPPTSSGRRDDDRARGEGRTSRRVAEGSQQRSRRTGERSSERGSRGSNLEGRAADRARQATGRQPRPRNSSARGMARTSRDEDRPRQRRPGERTPPAPRPVASPSRGSGPPRERSRQRLELGAGSRRSARPESRASAPGDSNEQGAGARGRGAGPPRRTGGPHAASGGAGREREPRRGGEPSRGSGPRGGRFGDGPVTRKWGSVARHGARELSREDEGQRRDEPRSGARATLGNHPDAGSRRPTSSKGEQRVPDRWDERVWIREVVGVEPGSPASPTTRTGRRVSGASVTTGEGTPLPSEVKEELDRSLGRAEAADVARKMTRAASAYERDRYADAFRMTRALVDVVPESPAVRELHGLVCYRLGRWHEAARHLDASRRSTADPSQLPVLMDCRRALGHSRKVEALWEELRECSPHADVLAEGRMVLAEHRADRGDIQSAIELMVRAGVARNLRHPAERHVRQWYVLADLYERAGDLPRARELFGRVAAADPDLADAAIRLTELGRAARSVATRPKRPSTASPRRRKTQSSGQQRGAARSSGPRRERAGRSARPSNS
jgi:hypothetical protein